MLDKLMVNRHDPLDQRHSLERTIHHQQEASLAQRQTNGCKLPHHEEVKRDLQIGFVDR